MKNWYKNILENEPFWPESVRDNIRAKLAAECDCSERDNFERGVEECVNCGKKFYTSKDDIDMIDDYYN